MRISLKLAADLPVQRLLTSFTSRRNSAPCFWSGQNLSLRVQGIRLDQYTLKFQLAQQLPAHWALLVFTCCVAGLADRHTQLNAESPGR